MEETKTIKKRQIKILIIALLCFVSIGAIIGYTYSYFALETSNNTKITGTAETNNIKVTVTKMAPTTSNGLTPQLDTTITQAIIGANGNNCVNAKSNEVCEIHKIEVTNNGSSEAYLDGALEIINYGNPNLKWALIDNYEVGMTIKPEIISKTYTSENTFFTVNEKYESKESKTYYIVLWISETGSAQTDSGTFNGTVMFKNTEKNYAINTLTELHLTDSIKTNTPDFSKTSCSSGCDEATVGIYSIGDDLGTSYYFRGEVTNNYVKFGKWSDNAPDVYHGFPSYVTNIYNDATYKEYSSLSECQTGDESGDFNTNCTLVSRAGKDMYWRIIRINGDGTVRMIYDGTSAHENGESSADRHVAVSLFNSTVFGNGTIGYMYGEESAATYAETHENKYNSDIKTYLENTWYEENLKDTEDRQYEQYIADAIYCNDRSLDTRDASFTGIGTTNTQYAAYQRIYSASIPKLTCQNSNDRFTMESTNFNIETNGRLEAPVGLITVDEIILAGASSIQTKANRYYYLYTNHSYWTMTPNSFYYTDGSNNYATEFISIWNGSLFENRVNTLHHSIRPVITLKVDALKYNSETSNGSKDYPFTVTG